MAEQANSDFQTVLGPDSSFKGELHFDKGVRVHGRFEGKITTAGRLHVAKEAKLVADVEANSVVVEGEVKGRLIATDKLEFKQTARYEGDVRATRVVVEEGAIFSGQVTVGPDAVKGANAPTSSSSAAKAISSNRDISSNSNGPVVAPASVPAPVALAR